MADIRANWAGLDIDDEAEVRAFGKIAERLGRQAIADAIAGHKAAGNPVYFSAGGRIIKELPDGRQFELRLTGNGREQIVMELPGG